MPATSVAVQATVLVPRVVVFGPAQDCESMPDKASVAFGVADAVLFKNTGLGETAGGRVGAVLSMLLPFCESDAVLPA